MDGDTDDHRCRGRETDDGVETLVEQLMRSRTCRDQQHLESRAQERILMKAMQAS